MNYQIKRRESCRYLNVCKINRMVLKEGYEFLEVLFCWEIMTTIRPDGLENTVAGDQSSCSGDGTAGQEARVLEQPFLLPPNVQSPHRAQHEYPFRPLHRANQIATLFVH